MAEAFFARLPRGSLTREESELRGLLLDAAGLAARLLPRSGAVSLQQWVERRMPEEIVFGKDASGMCNLRPVQRPVNPSPTQATGVKKEAFFVSLGDSFSANELRLHDAVCEYLSRGPAAIGRVVNDGPVKQAKGFLPQGVLLEDWIERRIGAEVVVNEGKGGEKFCKLAGPSKEEKMSIVEAFFEDLPDDSFTEAELQLRAAIIDVMEQKQGCTILSMIGADKEVGTARRSCLPPGVSLKEWMLRRVASEFEMEETPNGQWTVRFLAENGHNEPPQDAGRQHVGKGEARGPVDEEHEEQRKLAQQDQRELRESFFAELPDGSLLTDELNLREAIIEFIEQWHGDIPPTLSNAGTDEKVNACRAQFLRKGVSLRDWVDYRIGGELETIRLEGETSEVFIGKRGEIDPIALQRGMDRLKESKRARVRTGGHDRRRGRDRGGKDKGGKGKGIPSSKGKGGDRGNGKGKSKGGEPSSKRRRM